MVNHLSSQEEEETPSASSYEEDLQDDGDNSTTNKSSEYEYYTEEVTTPTTMPSTSFVRKVPLSSRLYGHAEVFVRSMSENLIGLRVHNRREH